jgi:hypothetical protein
MIEYTPKYIKAAHVCVDAKTISVDFELFWRIQSLEKPS